MAQRVFCKHYVIFVQSFFSKILSCMSVLSQFNFPLASLRTLILRAADFSRHLFTMAQHPIFIRIRNIKFVNYPTLLFILTFPSEYIISLV